MEFLVEFEVEVPAGTPDAEVERRQRAEQTVELRLAVGGVEADYRCIVRHRVPSPDAKKMAFVHEPGRRGRLGARALLDLALGRPLRNLDLELDQELHHVPPLARRAFARWCRRPMPAAPNTRFTASP